MEKNWLIDLFEKQYKFDNFIIEKNNSTVNLNDILNAYYVEVGEFLNEVRAFKHWSCKEMSKVESYEEFVDGLHFLLSIGNYCWGLDKVGVFARSLEERLERIEPEELNLYKGKDDKYKDRFVSRSVGLFKYSNTLHGTLEDYIDYFVAYMRLGFNVGMSIEDIVLEYNKKHEINYLRQKQGY